jgi:hypothetical protein
MLNRLWCRLRGHDWGLYDRHAGQETPLRAICSRCLAMRFP